MHYICVHGVCHGGWCWEETRADLERQGHRVSTPDLPLSSLEDDANAVRDVLDRVDGPSVLVGHSYGGLVISKAAANRTDVVHLVYVAAVMIGKNDVFLNMVANYPSELSDHMITSDDGGSFTISDDGARQVFYNCCEPHTAEKATSRLRSTSMLCLAVPPDAEPWLTIASTYILCLQDKAITAELQQEMAKNANKVIELDTDHSPFYSSREEFSVTLCSLP